jgi:hypothetical protein
MPNNKIIIKKYTNSITLVFVSLFFSIISFIQPASATSLGQYFSNNVDGCYVGSGKEFDNLGTLIGTSFDGTHGYDFGDDQDYKDEFIDIVENKINWISRKYIILTMLGYETAGRGVDVPISAEEDAAWRDRVNNPSIYMKIASYSFSTNTALCNFGYGNVLTYNDTSRAVPALVFYKETTPNTRQGIDYYAIKLDCLNPIGNLPGLPITMTYHSDSTLPRLIARLHQVAVLM